MTDLEITRLCAEAMGIEVKEIKVDSDFSCEFKDVKLCIGKFGSETYDPLHDDAQAMALVKKLELWIWPPNQGHLSAKPSPLWFVAHSAKGGDSKDADLNRAICECCAKMMLTKKESAHDAKTESKDR